MIQSTPLPQNLITRYQKWRSTDFQTRAAHFADLADNGQHPQVMAISCCDSRVIVSQIFGAEPGDFFTHRNIANLVPPFAPETGNHGTAAAIEYAVVHLKVAHIIVMGHALCGGIAGCFDMCAGNAPELEEDASSIGRWIDALRPAYAALGTVADRTAALTALEHEGVKMSLRNLMTYPYVAEAIGAGQLELHGLWTDIKSGALEHYDADADAFRAV